MSKIAYFPNAPAEAGQDQYGDEFDIPAGRYQASLIDVRTHLYFKKSAKVILTFRIQDYGPHFGTKIRGFYAVKDLKGKPRKNGTFEAGPKSRLLRDMARMMEDRPPTNRVPTTLINAAVYEIELRRVTEAKKVELPESIQYSVVDHVVRKVQ